MTVRPCSGRLASVVEVVVESFSAHDSSVPVRSIKCNAMSDIVAVLQNCVRRAKGSFTQIVCQKPVPPASVAGPVDITVGVPQKLKQRRCRRKLKKKNAG